MMVDNDLAMTSGMIVNKNHHSSKHEETLFTVARSINNHAYHDESRFAILVVNIFTID